MKKLMEKTREYPFTTALFILFVLGMIAIGVFAPQGWLPVLVAVGSMLLGGLIAGTLYELMS